MELSSIPVERLREFRVSRLSKQLKEYGIEEDPDDFVDSIVELHHGLYPAYSIDELLVRPRAALRFCDAVRDKYQNLDVPDDMSLRPLLNRRKHS